MYSNFFCTPRLSSISARMPPMYSSRVITVASMIGSSIFRISEGFGKFGRVIDLDHFVLDIRNAVTNAGRGRDQIDIELALQPLLHDLQMQQAEEAAAETEPERHRIFRLETHRTVVQTKFFERVAQHAVLVRFHRIQAREHHRLDLFEAGQRLRRPDLSASVMVSPTLASATFLMLA